MKQQTGLNSPVSRRSVLALVVSGLSGCGGGSGGNLLAALPGTGGTGLFAQGAISGFGSVIINGIRFDDTAASVKLDGRSVGSQDLRLGMVANVAGVRGVDLTVGVANTIEVWSIAQGLVSQVQGLQFRVAGMQVLTDAATVFDGVSAASGLVDGMRVAVWGLQSSADASRWMATRVSLTAATPTVSTGMVSAAKTLNGLALTGQNATVLLSGQLVRIEGALSSAGNSLQVETFRLLSLQETAMSQGDLEIEGLVNALMPGSRFMLGNVEVDASNASLALAYAALTIGQRIEVEGVWVGRVLKAGKLELESDEKLDAAEIEARIEQFTSLSSFVIRGQHCNASAATISNGKASDLKVGVKVKVKGTKAGDTLMVTKLEFKD